MHERWVWRGGRADGAGDLRAIAAAVPGRYGELVARLLWNRGVRDARGALAFLTPTLAQGLRSPMLLPDMARAVERLVQAMARGERIGLVADASLDGLAAMAVLVPGLRALGAEPALDVPVVTPARGVTSGSAVAALHAAGVRVIVAPGADAFSAPIAGAAAGRGVDVIACGASPGAAAGACALRGFPGTGDAAAAPELSVTASAFYLLMGLRMAVRAGGRRDIPDLREYLDLVALGTVAVQATLREENRTLVTHGLRRIDRTPRPGVAALKESALLEGVSVRDITERLVPRLAVGWCAEDVRAVLELLTTRDGDRARALAARCEMWHAERRTHEAVVLASAEAQLAGEGGGGAHVVTGEGWHLLAVEAVAARLAAVHRRCVILIAIRDGMGHGYACGGGAVDVQALLEDCDDVLEALDPRCPGRFVVRADGIGALRRRVDASLGRRQGDARTVPALAVDAEISLAAVTPELAATIARLGPHGPGNPEATFLARGVEVVGMRTVGEAPRAHLKLRVKQDARTVSALGVGLGAIPVHVGMRVDAVCSPRLRQWCGRQRLDLDIFAVRPATCDVITQGLEMERQYAIP